jgi:SagB-type dehydrogenase family enzyme
VQSEFLDGEPATIRLWSLSEDTLVEVDEAERSLVVVTRWGELSVPDADAHVRELLGRMGLGPVFLENVTGEASDDSEAGASVEKVLDQISGSVVHSLGLHDGQAPLLSAIPVVFAPSFTLEPLPGSRQVKLSRFSLFRPAGGVLTLEASTAQFRVELHQPTAVQVASVLATAISVSEIAAQTKIAPSVVADIVSYLVAAGLVEVAGENGRFAEERDADLRDWSHHDLQFHQHSRTTRPVAQAGPSSAERTEDSLPPVVKEVVGGQVFPLYRPELGALPADRRSLTELLEDDHLCPDITDRQLTADQLGELLFRSARVRSVGPAHLRLDASYPASQRPYFNIACLYELELYLSLNGCAGLPDAIYHYDPLEHALTLINEDPEDRIELLDMAKVAAGSVRQPSALITVTTRIGRVSWAFGGAAYATALMHLGTLQQTLYLVAKAMGLAAHAVPADANDIVDRALRLRWPAEVSLGECVVASHL